MENKNTSSNTLKKIKISKTGSDSENGTWLEKHNSGGLALPKFECKVRASLWRFHGRLAVQILRDFRVDDPMIKTQVWVILTFKFGRCDVANHDEDGLEGQTCQSLRNFSFRSNLLPLSYNLKFDSPSYLMHFRSVTAFVSTLTRTHREIECPPFSLMMDSALMDSNVRSPSSSFSTIPRPEWPW